jgi:predicted enzyme related to lactoylglutathione lyase
MPEFTSHPAGTPSWVDLMSPDVDASKAFYTAVFGWDAEDQFDDEGNRVYVMFSLNGKSVAGLGGQAPGMEGMPAVWNTYVATDDTAATVARVMEHGGQVLMPPMQVFDSGEMAIFMDPTGASFSVWKAGEHIGAEICNEPNTYSWNELMTRGIEDALVFYSKVFDWAFEPQQMPDGSTYHVIAGGEHGGLGGVMAMPDEMPDEVPNHWAVYFAVADLDDTLGKITANGGEAVFGPMDIPGVGRTATIHDPASGSFSILQPAME